MTETRVGKVTLWFGALVLAAVLAALPAFADDNENNGKNSPVISEVFVSFGDRDDDTTLTINGKNLLGTLRREETRVMLGDLGPLDILSSSDTGLVVRCYLEGPPQFRCEDGDYKLRIMVVEVKGRRKKNNNRYRNRGTEKIKRLASYDLTIGAVGPQGIQGIQGIQGEKGDKGNDGEDGDKGGKGDKGDKGDDGDKGDQGDQGPPGPVAAIGTACPPGEAVTGFDQDGNLICTPFDSIPNVPSVASCAEGVLGEEFTPGMMVGCQGTAFFVERATLCGPGSRVCTAQEWVDRRGGATPQYHYWTDDPLQFNGTLENCFVSTTVGLGSCATTTPMRVCKPTRFDPLNNECNVQQCGFEAVTPNLHFGGCTQNRTAGTLCCAG